MKKNLKITLIYSLLLSVGVSIGCIPLAFDGLPTKPGESAPPNPRADLCSLLINVGGTQADVDKCLTITTISDEDKARLCSLSSNLTEAQKETVKTELTKLGVNVEESCPIARTGPVATATPSAVETPAPTVVPTAVPTTEPTPAPTVPGPTIQPTPSNAPIPSTTPLPTIPPLRSHPTSEDMGCQDCGE